MSRDIKLNMVEKDEFSRLKRARNHREYFEMLTKLQLLKSLPKLL